MPDKPLTCKECKWWGNHSFLKDVHVCENEKVLDDIEQSSLKVTADFGCIHAEGKE